MIRLGRYRLLLAAIIALVCGYFTAHHTNVQLPRAIRLRKSTTSLTKPHHHLSSHNCSLLATSNELPKESSRKLWGDLTSIYQSHAPPKELRATPDRHVPPGSAVSATHLRTSHTSVVEEITTLDLPADLNYEGSGIVILAGSSRDQFTATCLGMLRLKGTTLPVELWFNDREEWESYGEHWCQDMQAAGFGVACRVLEDYTTASKEQASQPSSPTRPAHNLLSEDQAVLASILFSSFQNVLYLAPETLATKSLDTIFSSLPFQSTGAVLWPDFWPTQWGKYGRYVVGLGDVAVEHDEPEHEELRREIADADERRTVDKGLLMLDKSRHNQTLLLSLYHLSHPTFAPVLSAQASSSRLLGASLHASLLALRALHHIMPFGPEQVARGDAGSQPSGSGVSVLFREPAPADQGVSETAFLRTSIVRFGVRDMMCDKSCVERAGARRRRRRRWGAEGLGHGLVPAALRSLLGRLGLAGVREGSVGGDGEERGRLGRSRTPLPRQRMIGTEVRTIGAVATQGDPLYQALNEGWWVLSKERLEEKGGEGVGELEGEIWRVLERVACEGGGLGSFIADAELGNSTDEKVGDTENKLEDTEKSEETDDKTEGKDNEVEGTDKRSVETNDKSETSRGDVVSGLCHNVRDYLGKAKPGKGPAETKHWRGCAI